MSPVSDAADVALEHVVVQERLPDLVDLFSSQWWTSDRRAKDVIRMLAGSEIVVAAIDRISDRFVVSLVLSLTSRTLRSSLT